MSAQRVAAETRQRGAVTESAYCFPSILADTDEPALLSLRVRQIHSSAWLLMLLSAVLQVLIFPLPGIYILSWLALAPLIVALLRARPAGELEVAGSVRLQPASPWQGFLAGLCLRDSLVRRHVLLDLRHDAPVWRPERADGRAGAVSVLLLSRLVSRILWIFVGLLAEPRDYRRALVASLSLGRGGTGAHADHGISVGSVRNFAGR